MERSFYNIIFRLCQAVDCAHPGGGAHIEFGTKRIWNTKTRSWLAPNEEEIKWLEAMIKKEKAAQTEQQ